MTVLKSSEVGGDRYADAFRAAPAGIAIVDAKDPHGKGFLEVNEQFASLFGYAADDMRGMTMRDVTHPEDLARSADAESRFVRRDSDPLRMEKRFVRRDGEVFWGATHAVPVDSAEGESFIVVHVHDICERKQLERELARRRDELEQSQRHAEVGSFDLQVETGTGSFSDQVYRILGLDPETPPPTFEDYLAAVHPDDREAVRAAVQSSRAHVVEFRYLRPDGRVAMIEVVAGPVLDATGRPRAISGTMRDITRERAVEAALRAAEQLETAFEVSPLAQLLVTVGGAPRIAHVNAAAAAMAGRVPRMMEGRPLSEIVHRGVIPPELAAVIHGSAPRFRGQLALDCPGDVALLVDAYAYPVPTEGSGHDFTLLALRERAAGTASRTSSELSEREREILELVAAGSAGGGIATALHVSPETVKTHLSRIYQKLGVNDRAAAVAFALRKGWIR